MSLVKDYSQLNKIADEMVSTIAAINEKYLKENVEYPYGEVNKLINKYELMLNKILKKRYSLISDFLNKFSLKRRDMLRDLDAPNKYEILNMSSEKNILELLEMLKRNELVDEKSKKFIEDKMSPIIKNMNLKNIVYLYRQSKNIFGDNIDSLGYLQSMFVGYIISNIVHDPARGRSRSNVVWTYEEVCKNILNEDVIEVNDRGMSK